MLPKEQHVVNSVQPAPVSSPDGQAFTTFLMHVFPLNERLTAAGEEIARRGDQTLARWLVLEAVQDEPATVADIARVTGHARQGVQRLADALVASGAASYETNPRHRRASLLQITDEGMKSLRTIQAAQRVWADHLGAELGKAALDRASALLSRAEQLVAQGLAEQPHLDTET